MNNYPTSLNASSTEFSTLINAILATMRPVRVRPQAVQLAYGIRPQIFFHWIQHLQHFPSSEFSKINWLHWLHVSDTLKQRMIDWLKELLKTKRQKNISLNQNLRRLTLFTRTHIFASYQLFAIKNTGCSATIKKTQIRSYRQKLLRKSTEEKTTKQL